MVQNGAIIDRRQRGIGEEMGQNIVSNRDAVSTTQIASTRAAEEVKAAMTIAKMMPRDEIAATTKIVNACKRDSLAKVAIYSYPRGGQNVSGPSIRLAEVMAQNWGNIDFGIIELEQRYGESTVMAYAWDLETNTRRQTQFTVKHIRTKGKGADKQHTNLDDPRDIYEMNANQGARRLRACILGVIPRDVQDAAMDEVKRTIAGDNETPFIDRIKKMVQAFAEVQVTQEMIENRLGYRVDKATEKDLFDLRGIFTAIRDGQYGREDYFEVAEQKQEGQSLVDKVRQQPQQQPQPANQTAPQQDQPTQANESAGAADEIPDDKVGTISAFTTEMEIVAVDQKVDIEDFEKCLAGLKVKTKINSNRTSEAMSARRSVLAAARNGKLDWKEGKIIE